MTNMINPLAEIRRKGFDADLHQERVRVWPRHKMNKADCQFVTAHLQAIVQELTVESNDKAIKNYFLWELPAPKHRELGGPEWETKDGIPGYMNGEVYSHG